MRVCVLGAGLAGLGAADLLTERGAEVTVLERADRPGGLAATFREGGFHYDCGPHRFHTKSDDVLAMVRDLLPGELLELERLSRIRLLDRYFVYPLSLGDVLKRMPLHRGAGMIGSYVGERLRNLLAPREEASFQGWVVKRFGRRLYDLYFGPYTEKLWGCPATDLSADWASQRITVPGLSGLVKATLFPGRERVRSLVSTFHYPRGGIGRISEALAERVESRGGRILYRTAPASIGGGIGGWRLEAAGATVECDHIVNTIPVDDYVALLGGLLPERVHRAAAELRFRAVVFLTLRVERRVEAGDHWIYTPEEEYLFNRLSIPENFDPDCSDEGSQVVFEFSCDRGDDIWEGRVDLREEAIAGGERLGLFGRDEALGSTVNRQAHAYPIYHRGYAAPVGRVLDALHELAGSVTCGRQGLFRYNNMDHSLEMGRYAALEVLGEGNVREQFAWTSDTWADG